MKEALASGGYQSGFISIVGCPNVGKSTLLNALVGQKVAIVSPKAQTTRNRITGIVTGEGFQMVFVDTPGIAAPRNRLGEYMHKLARTALDEVEAILLVIDPIDGLRERDAAIVEWLQKAKSPVIGVINKCDIALAGQMEAATEFLREGGCFAHILPISALRGDGVAELLALLKGYLVAGPEYFPGDMVTDQPERVICAEFIREKALLLLKEEVPHGIGVEIEQMALREEKELTDVHAVIYCEREGHKGIIIGKKGAMLKQLGQEARKEMEWMLGTRVNLQLFVKVRENWRNSPLALRELGYE